VLNLGVLPVAQDDLVTLYPGIANRIRLGCHNPSSRTEVMDPVS